MTNYKENTSQWFAIKTRAEFRSEELLAASCDEVFLPKEIVKTPNGKPRVKAAIPHVLFIKTTHYHALELETASHADNYFPFWIYRYPNSQEIQPIRQSNIDLLRLITSDDTSGCCIYTDEDFIPGQRVKVIGGIFKNHEGSVKRIGRNRHVVVSIEGLCLVLLPFIHPDLLQKLD